VQCYCAAGPIQQERGDQPNRCILGCELAPKKFEGCRLRCAAALALAPVIFTMNFLKIIFDQNFLEIFALGFFNCIKNTIIFVKNERKGSKPG
jgi:hypothetical protein